MPFDFELYDRPILTSYLEVDVVVLRLHSFLQTGTLGVRLNGDTISLQKNNKKKMEGVFKIKIIK